MSKLTPWFPHGIQPVREGWYEVHAPELGRGGDNFRYWYGDGWSMTFGGHFVERYLRPAWLGAGYEFSCWRGLASDPSKAEG